MDQFNAVVAWRADMARTAAGFRHAAVPVGDPVQDHFRVAGRLKQGQHVFVHLVDVEEARAIAAGASEDAHSHPQAARCVSKRVMPCSAAIFSQ
jgi:hypothetical protein